MYQRIFVVSLLNVCVFFRSFFSHIEICFVDVRFKSRIDWFCTYFVHLEFVPSARLSHGALGLGFLFVAVLRCIFILYLYLSVYFQNIVMIWMWILTHRHDALAFLTHTRKNWIVCKGEKMSHTHTHNHCLDYIWWWQVWVNWADKVRRS